MNEKPSYEELESRIRRLEETEKKLRGTEAALNESRRRFVTLMDNLPGMVYRCRNDPRWTVEFISEGCLSLTGYDPSDFIGGSLVSLLTMIHEDDRQMVSTEVQAAVAETRPFQLEYRIVTAAGDEKWVWERGRAVAGTEGGEAFLEGFITDITEQKETEIRFSDELSRYRLLLEITRDGIVVMNADGSVREANRKFASMIGYPAEELPNLHVWDWDHSIAREDLDKMLAEVDERGEQFETRHVRRDGTEYDVEICGSGISYGGEKLIICICRDISGQKKAREALRQSEEKFRTLVENSTDAIARFDRQCRHLYVNPQTEKVTGLPKEAFIGKSSEEMGSPEELCRFFRENIEAVFSSGRRIETELQSPGGLCIEWVFMPERDGSGNVITVISSSRDVTERKRGEEEREKLIRELQEALAEIKALRGIIPICSFCKKIRDDSGYWEQVDTYLQRHKYADVSHSVCPECVRKYYPEIKDKI